MLLDLKVVQLFHKVSVSMFGCMPPRDVLLTVGNEILEATMSYRCKKNYVEC